MASEVSGAAVRQGARASPCGLLAVVLLVAVSSYPTDATLSFQRTTDLLSAASLFEEGVGSLPTRNFTFSITMRSGSGRNGVIMQRSSAEFYMGYWPASTGACDVTLASTSNLFYPTEKFSSVEATIMTMRTWTVAYRDIGGAAGELSLFIDDVHIGTSEIARPFSGTSMFGPNAIHFLTIGPAVWASYDDGRLTLEAPANDIDGLFGQFDGLQLWNRYLNASEISQISANPNLLTGNEEGLCIYWPASDHRRDGTRIPNLGSAGAAFDGVLGQYAVAVEETSNVFGTGCDIVSATSPTWANKSNTNTPPTVTNDTALVIESTSDAPTYAMLYFTGGFDAEGDMLDFAVTRLPSHGILKLVSTVNASEKSVVIANVPYRCWETFARYRLVWWPEENSNEPVIINYRAYDGTEYSGDATIAVEVLPIDGVPDAAAKTYTVGEDAQSVNITLRATDVDSLFLSMFITQLPLHGTLYVRRNSSVKEISEIYSKWEIDIQPIQQHASNVRAVSTFWISDDDAGNGYPSWHAYQIIGPQDAPNVYSGSRLTYCPSTRQGDTVGLQSGSDAWLSYSHDTWASFVNDGYTEYIEVEIETAVFVQSIEIGENRGMWSIVKIKAWDSDTSHWQPLWSGEADVGQWEWYKNSKQYNKFMPAICQTSFASSIIRIEMDTFSVNDW